MAVPVNPLTDSFSVAPQLSAQPASQEVIQAAKAAGLEVVYQPVVSGAITAQDVSQFAQLLNSMPKPILAYCRSGTRCTQLFQAASTS